jgi:chaperonin GroES
MKFYPLADQIVVKLPKREEEKTVNGIILAATIQKEQDTQGVVVAVGSGRLMDNGTRVPPEVEVGDHVLFAKYAGTEIADGDDRVLILRERDIMAKLKTVETTEKPSIRVVH